MTGRQQNLFSSEQLPETPWEQAAAQDRMAVQVVFNRPLTTVFHYLVPDRLRDLVQPGQRLRAPFGKGNRLTVGFCVGVEAVREPERRLKSIEAVLDREPLLSAKMLELTRWIAGEQLCGWGQVLETVVPAGVKKKAGTRVVTFFEPAAGVAERLGELRLTVKQRAVLEAACRADRPLRADELSDAADCGTSPIHALRDKGLLRVIRERTGTFDAQTGPIEKVSDLRLNAEQQAALEAILAHLRAQRHHTMLLHGVTGSGKTEVYIQAIREVVSYGRQAIVLVPEISLTPQTIRRFRSRFDTVAVLHSHLTDSERHWHWQRIARGEVQVIVGARSAVFAPAPHLGLIVIDEEHETSFKQETTPRYHAREVARKRAEMEQIPLLLGSATPTLETWLRVQRRQDQLLSLPRRVEGLPLPPVVVVDVRNDPHIARGAAIGRALQTAMLSALRDGGQVILFLNLRGHSPTLWCHACGTAIRCPDCDVTLTWHRDRDIVRCHFCDYAAPPVRQCPQCASTAVRYFGIGTQRLEQEVAARFANYRCLRMDSDTMRRPGSHDEALEAFRRGEVQILLGTQMIAKGLDFPNVTLVGVVNADTMLHQPDLRAAERTFQLLAQVAGRTGRSARGGRVFVQSAAPSEPAIVLAAAHDYVRFATKELQHRHESHAPPYSRWCRIVLRGSLEQNVRDLAQQFSQQLRAVAESTEPAERAGSDVRILGPAPAPVARLKGLYRYHFLLAADELRPIQQLWTRVSPRLPTLGDVEFVVDVDPVNLR